MLIVSPGESVRPRLHDFLVLLAELICSDDECEVVLEATGSLEDLDLLVCEECGCCLQIVSISAHEAAESIVRVELALAA